MKIILDVEYLTKVLATQFYKNAIDWYSHEKTKRWYDYINMFSQYNTKQSEYSFRSEQLEKFQKRLTKHTEKVVELNICHTVLHDYHTYRLSLF